MKEDDIFDGLADPKLMEKWKANILPVPSAEKLKGNCCYCGSKPAFYGGDCFAFNGNEEEHNKAKKMIDKQQQASNSASERIIQHIEVELSKFMK